MHCQRPSWEKEMYQTVKSADGVKAAITLQGLRFDVETSRLFWKIQKECRAELALPVVVPPIPHALVFCPDLLQLDLKARERL